MGAAQSLLSCSSPSLFNAAADGDAQLAELVLARSPSASLAVTLVDRNSPIMLAASEARGVAQLAPRPWQLNTSAAAGRARARKATWQVAPDRWGRPDRAAPRPPQAAATSGWCR
jgi:hypothetical protein